MNRWVNDDLEEIISRMWFDERTTVTFVLGHNLSDIGKGFLTANLVNFLPDSNVVKYDSVYLSNYDARVSEDKRTITFVRKDVPVDIDDFKTYKEINPQLNIGFANSILGGDIDIEFNAFVSNRNSTTNVPDKMKYFISMILEKYRQLGSPRNLLVEIGGTLDAKEVELFALNAIAYLKNKLKDRCGILLLNEIGYRGAKSKDFFVSNAKTKELQQAFDILRTYMLEPDIIFLREPSHMPELNDECRQEFEEYIANQLLYRQKTFRNYKERIVSIPYFNDPDREVEPYLKKRFNELRAKIVYPFNYQ